MILRIFLQHHFCIMEMLAMEIMESIWMERLAQLPQGMKGQGLRTITYTHGWQLKVSVLGLRNTGKAHLWFKGHQYKAKQMSCHCVPATFYSLWNKCSSCRGADQLINWVIGLLRGNCMHIDSGHHRDTLRVCALPLALEPRSCYRISLV